MSQKQQTLLAETYFYDDGLICFGSLNTIINFQVMYMRHGRYIVAELQRTAQYLSAHKHKAQENKFFDLTLIKMTKSTCQTNANISMSLAPNNKLESTRVSCLSVCLAFCFGWLVGWFSSSSSCCCCCYCLLLLWCYCRSRSHRRNRSVFADGTVMQHAVHLLRLLIGEDVCGCLWQITVDVIAAWSSDIVFVTSV